MNEPSLLKESESIFLLRHRFGRTVEIWAAYQTFLRRQVEVGEDKICHHPAVVEQTTHTLLLVYYSFVYSLFDPSATNFVKAIEPYQHAFNDRAKELSKEIMEHWETIKDPINKIRHNIGFHGGKHNKSLKTGYLAYGDIRLHPQSPDYILNLMRLFLRELALVVESAEDFNWHISPEQMEHLYQYTRNMKKHIEETPIEEMYRTVISYLSHT